MPRIDRRDLSRPEDVEALRGAVRIFDRPDRLRLSSPFASRRALRRLEICAAACGCAPGGLSTLAALVGLVVFARGEVSSGLVGLWIAVIVGATLGGKLIGLFVTHAAAHFDLARIERRMSARHSFETQEGSRS